MAWIVGVDEAGYGPNLGPLVISATLWQVADDRIDADLYQLLSKVVCRSPSKDRSSPGRRVAWADSKSLYDPSGGLGPLERGLLAAAGLCGPRPESWHGLWERFCPESLAELAEAPWYRDYDITLPLVADGDDLDGLGQRLVRGFDAAGVRLVRIVSRAVFPDAWNDVLDDCGNKATALSRLSLNLLRTVLDELPDGEVSVVCDKHGGRNAYHALVQEHVSRWLVEIYREGAEASEYRWGPVERRVRALFCPKAERHLPVALASMASKYLRELAMRPFNEFWGRHVPELKPTAGYPLDARRFKAEILAAQTALGIEDRMLWRAR